MISLKAWRWFWFFFHCIFTKSMIWGLIFFTYLPFHAKLKQKLPLVIGVPTKSWSRNCPHDMYIIVRCLSEDKHLSPLWMALLILRAFGNGSPLTLFSRGLFTPVSKHFKCLRVVGWVKKSCNNAFVYNFSEIIVCEFVWNCLYNILL